MKKNIRLLACVPGAARQASTWLSGPRTNRLQYQFVGFKEELGKAVGTSPWHVVSGRRYKKEQAVTVWGVSLIDAYRLVVDGDRFEALDRIAINKLPLSIPWNLVMVDNGRVIIPDANGRNVGDPAFHTRDSSYVILYDDALDQPAKVERVVTLSPADLRRVCRPGVARLMRGSAGVSLTPTFTGEMATWVGYRKGEEKQSYLVILDENLQILMAERISNSTPSNAIPSEDLGQDRTAFYIPTDTSIVKMVYDARRKALTKKWERKIPLRGRTGTTPTLMTTSDGQSFVVLVDAKAAVSNVLNGLIVESPVQRPSALIAMRCDDDLNGRSAYIRTELPDWLMTVENSPAVLGDTVVIANYSGYLPNGLMVPAGGKSPGFAVSQWSVSPDARLDVATGVLALRFVPGENRFRTLWSDPHTQISGVPAISGGANRVYGSGAEEATGQVYFYAYRLHADKEGPAGERVTRFPLGKAPFRSSRKDRDGNTIIPFSDYQLKPGEVFDAGNNILILEDGSVLLSLGSGIARLRDL